MALTTYSSNGLLDLVLRNQTLTVSGSYMALHTADPGLTGANEIAAGWYSRQSITWAAATTSGKATSADLQWSAVTGSGVTVTHISVWDASTSGNCLWTFNVTDAAYLVGEAPRIASGNVTMTITGDISDYLYPKLLDHLGGGTAYTPASTIYSGLYTTNPAVGDTGTEVSGTGYAREATTFSAASSQAVDTAGDITFGPPTASWGTPAYYSIHDALTTGNLLIFGPASGLGAVESGDTVKIPSGSYDISWT